MKKKHLKIAALVTALALLGLIGFIANVLFGNPVSKMMARHTAKLYLEKQYPNTDYYIENVHYNFKDGNYNVTIYSKSSKDTVFTCSMNMLGTLTHDSYESDVANGFNVARRIDAEYRELTERIFESSSFPYKSDIAFGTLEIAMKENIENSHPYEVPPYALKQEELQLDKIYDIYKLGKEAGHLIIYLENGDVTEERAASQMLAIKALFDKANIPFRAMDFSLSTLKDTKETERKTIDVAHFPYEEIYEDGMVERIKEAAKELDAYYAREDAKK